MATAENGPLGTRQIIPGMVGLEPTAAMEFSVFEDSLGGYHWRIAAGSGDILVESGRFATYYDAEDAAVHEDFSGNGEVIVESGHFACFDDAEDAAHYVHDNVGSVRAPG